MRVCLFLIGICIISLPPCINGLDWKCLGCMGGVEVLKFLYQRNATGAEIISVARFICNKFADVTPTICWAITSEFQDTFLYVLGELVFRPGELCALLVSNCGKQINPFDSNWSLPLPPKPTSQRKAQSKHIDHFSDSVHQIRILQLSDIHIDFSYKEGTEAQCELPLCCTSSTSVGRKKPIQPAGYWGSNSKCDIPYRTVENLFQHLNQSEKVDFAILSGDYMSHRDWEYEQKEHLNTITNLSNLINTYLPNTPIYWALGNHEAIPVNQYAPHFAPQRFQPRWMYEAILSADRKYLPSSADQSTLYRGSYSVLIGSNLRLISLNTGYSETTNFFIYLNQTDPDGTLSWLIDELYKAEQEGQKAYIVAHIPPGSDTFEGWARNYYAIVNRFEDTIAGQFFGHIHVNTFSVFYENMNDPKSRPTSMLFSAPSVTTYWNLNPAYRIYVVDSHTAQLLDYETYFLNLTLLENSTGQIPPKWEFLYSAKKEYNLPDLSPPSWNDLIQRIQTDPSIAQKFLRNFYRKSRYYCDQNCLQSLICDMRSSHHNQSALCSLSTDKTLPSVWHGVPILNQRFKHPVMIDKGPGLTNAEFFGLVKGALWNKLMNWITKKS